MTAHQHKLLHAASLASLLLAPIAVVQGRQVRRRIPDIGPAAGATNGQCAGLEPALRLLVLGESPVAGYGSPDHARAISGQLAQCLREQTKRTIHWQALGKDGITAQRTRLELLPQLGNRHFDIVMIGLGVNDTKGLTRPANWLRQLDALMTELHGQCQPAMIILAGVPAMQQFPALPQPLAGMLGLRARLLDRLAQDLALARQVVFAPAPLPTGPQQFCADGFHPSPLGCCGWAQSIVAAIAAQAPGGLPSCLARQHHHKRDNPHA